MDYQKIRDKMRNEKGSRKNEKTESISFGDFSVMKASNGEWFIVDSCIEEAIKHRKWQIDPAGYVKTDLKIDGKKICVRLHDYVMSTVYDRKPEKSHIDHVNGCKKDNRKCNLRIVTPSFNLRNVRKRTNNTSGINGVSKSRNGKWRAYITVNRRQMSLGVYDKIEEAIKARYCAEEKLGFCHTVDMERYISSKLNMEFQISDKEENKP